MDFTNLPETLSSEELEQYFKNLILQYQAQDKFTLDEMITIFCDLSDKQWHNFERPNLNFQSYLDMFIVTIIENEKLPVDLIEKVGQIIGYLGLMNSYESLKQLKNSDKLSLKEKSVLSKILEEKGDSVTNPYKKFWE